MVLATDILQRVPGFSRSRAYVTYLSSCCRAVAALNHKPATLLPSGPAESLKPDPFGTDDPFAIFNDFPFEEKVPQGRKNNDTSSDGNKESKADDGDAGSEKISDSDSLNDILTRGQTWPAGSLATDPLSLTLTSSLPDSFSASPTWPRTFDFATNITNGGGTLGNRLYRTDNNNELQPSWPSASTTPVPQFQQPDNPGGWPQQQQQQQQLGQSGGRQPQQQWPQEMGMGFLMPESGKAGWSDSWLN